MEKNHMQIPRGKAGKTLIAEVFYHLHCQVN